MSIKKILENSITHRITSVLVVAFLTLLILLTPLLTLFHDDIFYDFAYQKNGAYESLEKETVWKVTENFQAFLLDEESLDYFVDAQADHLQEVKELYTLTSLIWRTIFFLSVALLLMMRKPSLVLTAAKVSFVALFLFLLLALHWQWFFTQFHTLVFSGNWQFGTTSLMLQLWGGNFFPLAAGYAFIQSLLLSSVLFLIGKKWEQIISPQ